MADEGELEPVGGGVATIEEAPAEPKRPALPTKGRIPFWIMPILVALPVYGYIYAGAFGNRAKAVASPVTEGNTIFHSVGCSGCHGTNGEGGVGPPLANVLHTFPNLADHISWVHTGSAPFAGKTYGNSGRVATGGMPAFASTLSDAQIADVVCYERVVFGGGPEAGNCPATPAG